MSAGDESREPELRELAALADGSLAPGRRAEVERRVAASPRLQALLAEQRRAVEAVRARDERASPGLHDAVARTRIRRGTSRPRVAAAGIAAAAAISALALILLPGSEEATPTLAQAAAISARTPSRGGPELSKAWGLEFPDLERAGGWRDLGWRVDRVGNREARTVYYAKDDRRIAYTILSSGEVRVPTGTRSLRRKRTSWYTFEEAGRTVVAWERSGHMCVVSASGLEGSRLVDLITR